METVAIRRGTATIALFDLNLPPGDLDACFALLDERERDRASRFRHARDRDRFVARRGQLRRHLARELGIAPSRVRMDVDEGGKPVLVDDPQLSFNLSHSHGLALCVSSQHGAVGCDIEWRDPQLACPRVAERLFAADEVAALSALPPERWVAGFFNCWTRKEAYVKALGLGLLYPLDAFTVSVAPGQPAVFTSDEPGWTMEAFEPAAGFQAAVVTAVSTVPA